MNKKKLRSFKPYLFDFLVIVLGVSVSFWFNQLAIKRSDNKERIKVLTSIEKEVNEIKKYCDERLSAWNDDITLYSQLISSEFDIDEIKKITSSKGRVEFNLIYFRDFEPPMNRYTSMINSGNIKFVRSESVKEALTRLHTLNFSRLKTSVEYEKSLKEQLIKVLTEGHPKVVLAAEDNSVSINRYASLLSQSISADEELKSNLSIQLKYFKTRVSLLNLYMYTLDELDRLVKDLLV
tara:strand:+ start:1780 stop:2490 length:711 start_codon:yes stop_codon:yes gene_type:complete